MTTVKPRSLTSVFQNTKIPVDSLYLEPPLVCDCEHFYSKSYKILFSYYPRVSDLFTDNRAEILIIWCCNIFAFL